MNTTTEDLVAAYAAGKSIRYQTETGFSELTTQKLGYPLVPLGENVTRDGRKARVICIDRQSDPHKPVVALVRSSWGHDELYGYEANGRVNLGSEELRDLVGHLPPEPPKPRECWINVGPQGQLNAPHDDPKEAAVVCAHNYRTALFREVLPGEGDLRRWKDEAMQFLNGIDLQAIGKELGLPLGTDIGPQILPKIREYRKLLERAKDLVPSNLYDDITEAFRP